MRFTLDRLVDRDGGHKNTAVLVTPQSVEVASIDDLAGSNSREEPQRRGKIVSTLAELYQGAYQSLSQKAAGTAKVVRREAIATLLAGALAAGCALALTNHTNSKGVKVMYPSDFSCAKIASDFGDYYNPDGSKRTWSAPHSGIDFIDDYVVAPAEGVVARVMGCTLPSGCQVAIYHDGKEINVAGDGGSFLSWFIHLKEIDNKNSAHKYVAEGQKVKRGQIIAEKGKTGSNVAYPGSIPHTHWQLYKNETGEGYIIRGNKEDHWPELIDRKVANPHDYWAPHELDVQGQVKYIPQFRSHAKSSRGFTYPALCPKNKVSLIGSSNKPLTIELNLDYVKLPRLGLDLDSFREEMVYKANRQFKKAA